MLSVRDSSGNVVAPEPVSHGDDADLEAQGTGPVRFTRTGGYTLHVRGGDRTRGAYRLRSYVVQTAPETVPLALRAGDTTRAEAIDDVGDVDELSFQAPAAGSYMLFIQPLTGLTAGLRVQLQSAGSFYPPVERVVSRPLGNLDSAWIGPIVAAAGESYVVRALSAEVGSRAAATGTYRLEMYRVDPRPEHVAAQVALGAVVSGERLDRPGDVDEFTIAVPAGTSAGASLFTRPDRGGFGGWVAGRPLDPKPFPTAYGAYAASTYRFSGGPSGTVTLRVADGVDSGATGAFTFETYPISTAPETAPPTISVGATIATEAMDRPGDRDVFTLAGDSGQTFIMQMRSPTGTPLIATLGLRDQPYAGVVSTLGTDTRSNGRLTLRASGTYVLGVEQANEAPEYLDRPAPYTLMLTRLNPAPETTPVAFAIGDTVRSEAIDPAGDVDEFTFHANAGDRLGIYFSMTGPRWTMFAIVTGPAGEPVAGAATYQPPELAWFEAPVSGTYHLRITSSLGDFQMGSDQTLEHGPYAFAIYRR